MLRLTETRSKGKTPDRTAELTGFLLVRADRNKQSDKKLVGGRHVFINDKWCNPGRVTMKVITSTRTLNCWRWA